MTVTVNEAIKFFGESYDFIRLFHTGFTTECNFTTHLAVQSHFRRLQCLGFFLFFIAFLIVIFLPANTSSIRLFSSSQYLSMTCNNSVSSVEFSSDHAISIFFCPFSSIQILATVLPQCERLLPLRTTWMCLRFSKASAGNTERMKHKNNASLSIYSMNYMAKYKILSI